MTVREDWQEGHRASVAGLWIDNSRIRPQAVSVRCNIPDAVEADRTRGTCSFSVASGQQRSSFVQLEDVTIRVHFDDERWRMLGASYDPSENSSPHSDECVFRGDPWEHDPYWDQCERRLDELARSLGGHLGGWKYRPMHDQKCLNIKVKTDFWISIPDHTQFSINVFGTKTGGAVASVDDLVGKIDRFIRSHVTV